MSIFSKIRAFQYGFISEMFPEHREAIAVFHQANNKAVEKMVEVGLVHLKKFNQDMNALMIEMTEEMKSAPGADEFILAVAKKFRLM